MVKATVNFDDELYRKLIRETVERYGKMRGFSKLVNEKLRKVELETKSLPTKNVKGEDKKDVVERTFGSWKINENGVEYVRRVRKGWGKRAKRLGI